ncbi:MULTISPECIES: hypothetical protein [Achromobacter]|uniref:hypothetical protein n=1 Tax=Achromobacter TaxID=222 RepID=UPI0013C4BE22|nr:MULTISPECIES: hypothetical protein [Achromobacter]
MMAAIPAAKQMAPASPWLLAGPGPSGVALAVLGNQDAVETLALRLVLLSGVLALLALALVNLLTGLLTRLLARLLTRLLLVTRIFLGLLLLRLLLLVGLVLVGHCVSPLGRNDSAGQE